MAGAVPLLLYTSSWHGQGNMCIFIIHKEKSNKMQQCIKILLFNIYMKLNTFQATRRPSSGA
jgi:hypothetical protein